MKKAVLLRSCAALFVPFAAATFVASSSGRAGNYVVDYRHRHFQRGSGPECDRDRGPRTERHKEYMTTDAAGAYTAAGVETGGPYTVSASAPGFASTQVTDVYTTLGQTFELPLTLQSTGKEIVVTASRVRGARSISEGPATVLNANDISKVASVNRDIRDLMQRDPSPRSTLPSRRAARSRSRA